MYCKYCKNPLNSGDLTCPKCGRKNLIFREGNGFWDLLEDANQIPLAADHSTGSKELPEQILPPSGKNILPSRPVSAGPDIGAIKGRNRQKASLNIALLCTTLILLAAVAVLSMALLKSAKRDSEPAPSYEIPVVTQTSEVPVSVETSSVQPELTESTVQTDFSLPETDSSTSTDPTDIWGQQPVKDLLPPGTGKKADASYEESSNPAN